MSQEYPPEPAAPTPTAAVPLEEFTITELEPRLEFTGGMSTSNGNCPCPAPKEPKVAE